MPKVVVLSPFAMKKKKGQGKSTYTFSTQRRRISAFCLLALTTEAWRGVEISRRLAENVYVDLPGPEKESSKTSFSSLKTFRTKPIFFLQKLSKLKCLKMDGEKLTHHENGCFPR
jgi:hypothetical protein